MLANLEALPQYAAYVNSVDKQSDNKEFYSRAAIPWKLNCENLNLDRASTMAKLGESNYVNQTAGVDLLTCLVCMIGVCVIFIPLYMFTLVHDSQTARVVTVIVVSIAQFAIAYFIFGFVPLVGRDTEEIRFSVTSLTMIDLCSDE